VAQDRALGRWVAIKGLAERFAQDESLRTRFTREALAAARLSTHPHVVTIFDVGEWRERPFIVMEYLSGGDPRRARAGEADRAASGARMARANVAGARCRPRRGHRPPGREARHEALPHLDRSERLQGEKAPITDAEEQCDA
jgi:hypothetical protein